MKKGGYTLVGVFFALVTALCFAFSNVHHRKAARTLTGEQAIAVNLALNALIFLPLALMVKAVRGTPWPDLQTLGLYALVGFVAIFLGRWGLYNAIALMGPSRASAVKNCSPAFTLLLGFLLYARLPELLPLLGIGAILLGVWLLGREKNLQPAAGVRSSLTAQRSSWAMTMAFGLVVAFIFAAGEALRALAMQRVADAILASGVAAVAAWVSMLVLLALRGKLVTVHRQYRRALNKDVLLAVTWSGVAQVTNFAAVKLMFFPYVSALVATAPLLTAVVSYVLLRDEEHLTPSLWISAVLLVTGAALISLFQ